MKTRIKYTNFIVYIFICVISYGQDPHYSQFFMAPSLLNPGMTGATNDTWLVMSNFRQQWSNAGTPFNTYSVSGDMKLLGNSPNGGTLGLSACLLSDQSMLGAFKSNYMQTTLAYHVKISENQKVGLGISGSYGQRRLDYSQLTFGEQFTSGGFDVTLPTGESALSNMKPFFSISSGILYSYQSEYLGIQAGIAAFHLNGPKQSFISDPQQLIPERYVAHINADYSFSDRMLFYFNSAFQRQATQQYISVGGAAGFDLSNGDRTNILFTGAWFRQGDAVYPYIGMKLGSAQVGLTYDVTTSKQIIGSQPPTSIELSILFRPQKSIPGVIPCPWR